MWELPTCSAFTTSIITPPFNIRARPVLTVKVDSALPFCAVPCPLVMGSSEAILPVWSSIICLGRGFNDAMRVQYTGAEGLSWQNFEKRGERSSSEESEVEIKGIN